MFVFKNFQLLNDEEHQELLEVRNNDYIRLNMHQTKKISLEEHRSFIRNLQKNSQALHYAVFDDTHFIGAIYLTNIDLDRKECFLGLYFKYGIHPIFSSLVTFIFLDHCFNHFKFETIYLEVLQSNTKAVQFDLNFGFRIQKEFIKDNKSYYFMSSDLMQWNETKNSKRLNILQSKINKTEFVFKG